MNFSRSLASLAFAASAFCAAFASAAFCSSGVSTFSSAIVRASGLWMFARDQAPSWRRIPIRP